MAHLDANYIASKLEARFGIAMTEGTEKFDGGTFSAIRPTDLEAPNGFAVIVARTPRIVEASLKFDGFARPLLRQMSEADDVLRSTFTKLASQAHSDGCRINVGVNGEHIDNFSDLPQGEWTQLQVDCDQRLSGRKVTDNEINDLGLEVARVCFSLVLSLLPVEEITESVSGFEPGLPEGAKIRVEVNRYERSPVNRAACISHYGARCQVCGFDFYNRYGPHGSDYIEVHHRVPVSEMGGSYRVDPVKDLVPVCANCHAMLHRIRPALELDHLRSLIESQEN